jgi:H+-translocating NAD(P) transhydrogenase subunit beta
MSPNQITLWYLVASVCFILALKGLSHPESARRGNWFGMAGMAIAMSRRSRWSLKAASR